MSILKNATEHWPESSVDKGFTLLEVMVCVGILSFIVISLFSVQAGSIKLTNKNKSTQEGPMLAQKVLALNLPKLAELDLETGDFGPEFAGITWTCSAAPAEFETLEYFTAENLARLKKITITIKDATGSNTFEMMTWRLVSE